MAKYICVTTKCPPPKCAPKPTKCAPKKDCAPKPCKTKVEIKYNPCKPKFCEVKKDCGDYGQVS